MGPVYHGLGMSVACLQHELAYVLDPDVHSDNPGLNALRLISRRDAYDADITYGTNHEFGFDYLRDNMAVDKSQQVRRGHHYAIVDEVDNILIDEAPHPAHHQRSGAGGHEDLRHHVPHCPAAGAGR